MTDLYSMFKEIKEHLIYDLLPFWLSLRDDENGGYYGEVGFNRDVRKQAVKWSVVNSRILWFFSQCYLLCKDGLLSENRLQDAGYSSMDILDAACHAYDFMMNSFYDEENGGLYWAVTYDGKPEDTTKHTYNQVFAVYALAAFYKASGHEEAIRSARKIKNVIEEKCVDDIGYLESFKKDFTPEDNEKLSENGIMAEKTMNTLIHGMEAYAELFSATGDLPLKEKVVRILDIFETRIYNPVKRRQEVFFDKNYNSILDLHSYGHDIEMSWFLDRTLTRLGDESLRQRFEHLVFTLADTVKNEAFDGRSIAYECENGVVKQTRAWWMQSEAFIGFLNIYMKDPTRGDMLDAACAEWEFIRDFMITKEHPAEWYNEVSQDGVPDPSMDIVSEWKSAYHSGRLCVEAIRRAEVLEFT